MAKDNKLSLILKTIKPYKRMIVGMVISLLITSSAVLAISKGLSFFIDKGIVKGEASLLNQSLYGLLAIIIILAFFTALRFYLITMVGEKVVTDLRRNIYKHILYLSPGFFEKNRVGEILSRLTADTTVLLTVIGSSISVAMRNFIMLVGGIIMLINTSLKLASILLVLIPIIVMPLVIARKRLREYTRVAQDKVADLTAQCEQTLNSIKTIQSYLRESHEEAAFNEKLTHQLNIASERVLLRSGLTALIIFLAFGGIAFVLWVGGQEVLKGALSAGELSAFIYIGVICAGAVTALSDVVGDIQKAIGATERIFEFLATKPDVIEAENPLRISKNAVGKIEFKNVTFGYDSKKRVLDNISFTIEPGKVTALIGKSGVGKTTVFMLLERFYDINSGEINFDDQDIRKIKISDLRAQFTYVTQEPILFSATAYENILYGDITATHAQVIKAATEANCMEFIEKMPQGLDTYLGDKGMKLSGGQKQRMAIARAILNNPKILLLDEATSSLDSENEHLLHGALETLMQGRTTIVIAHRLSTVKKADKIIVLENGQIVEEGTHQSLIGRPNGVYKRLASFQLIGSST